MFRILIQKIIEMNALKSGKVGGSVLLHRIFYGGFVLLSLWHALFSRDFGDAAMTMGIALIFDPFDQSVRWNDRPAYQRLWLIVHLGVGLGFLVKSLFF